MRGLAVLFLVFSLASVPPASAGPPAAARARVLHTVQPSTGQIRVDGTLDEALWETAWSIELAYEVTPGENTPAPVRTVALVTYDAGALYVAFKAYDPDPSAIRAHLTDRDSAWGDDWIGIVLDTFNDERRDYLLLVNPLGVQMDNIEVSGSEGQEWDGIWDAATRITEWGWSAEFKVPFATLSFQRAAGPQTWGFDAVRGYPRRTFRQMGAFSRDRNNNCYLCQAIKISGFEGATPGRNLELTPTVTTVTTSERQDFPAGDMRRARRDGQAGISGRWGITPNLIVSGTVNPDFSQVEADALQLDVNEPFALSYAEKRPFFMEASDFFATPLTAVYTRTLREPVWGSKLTGKIGGDTVGAFVVRDDLTNVILPGSQGSSSTSLVEASTASVFRYKRDLGSKYTLGALATLREGGRYFNRLAGLDANLRFSGKDRLSVQILGSATRYSDTVARSFRQPRDQFGDWAGIVNYTHSTRNLYANAGYTTVGDGFRADLGFMPRVDYRRARGVLRYQWLPEGRHWFTNINVSGEASYDENQRGEFLQRNALAGLNYQGPLQSHVAVQLGRKRELFAGRTFDQTTLYVHNCMQPTGNTNYSVNIWVGDRIDYANIRPGQRVRVQGNVSQRFGSHLQLQVAPSWERMTVQPGRLYSALMTDLNVAYQFTSRVFLRGIMQYADYDYNSALYMLGRGRREQRVSSQVLFSYKVNPRTVLFLGYADSRLGGDDYDLTQNSRTVFAKVGYAWTF